MNAIDKAIVNALEVNMGYRAGEDILVVAQKWGDHLDEQTKPNFERGSELAQRMFTVLSVEGFAPRIVEYTPTEARHGVDVPKEFYEKAGAPQVVFMPTAYSLSHTPFRRHLTSLGSRVASMPTFTLDMFEEGGPMSADYRDLDRRTEEIAAKLRENPFVSILGERTSIVIEVDTSLVHCSSGLFTKDGQYGNLPGAEAYCVPVHLGRSGGHITVPKNWGGASALEYAVTFEIEDGRFVDARGDTTEAQAWIDKNVKPGIFFQYGAQPNFDILAELGIGVNPNVNEQTLKRYGWTPLLSEKIGGSAHFANGNSAGMGGKNEVPVHVDWVVPNVNIGYNFKP